MDVRGTRMEDDEIESLFFISLRGRAFSLKMKIVLHFKPRGRRLNRADRYDDEIVMWRRNQLTFAGQGNRAGAPMRAKNCEGGAQIR